MPFLHFRPLTLLCGILLVSISPTPQAVDAAPLIETPTPKSPPASEAVRAAIYAHLEKQAEAKAQLPDFPSQNLRAWVNGRYAVAAKANTKNPKARYALLLEHLLIAQKLLDSDDLTTQKQGFGIANRSAHFAAVHLPQDKWLTARLYEGFLVPHIALANPQNYQAPSRRKVLESAFGAFANAGESAKQKGILEWLISIGDKPQPANSKSLALGTNTLDWARGTLASLLMQPKNAPRADLERALALLQAIESKDMGGFQHLQVTLQQRLERLPSASLTSPTSHSLPQTP